MGKVAESLRMRVMIVNNRLKIRKSATLQRKVVLVNTARILQEMLQTKLQEEELQKPFRNPGFLPEEMDQQTHDPVLDSIDSFLASLPSVHSEER